MSDLDRNGGNRPGIGQATPPFPNLSMAGVPETRTHQPLSYPTRGRDRVLAIRDWERMTFLRQNGPTLPAERQWPRYVMEADRGDAIPPAPRVRQRLA
jgi:hypothetical protein